MRERNEQSQPAIEEVFQAVAESVPAMIWTSDPDGLCTFCSKSWLDFRGRSFEEERGRGWMDGIHPEDHERCVDTYGRLLKTPKAFEMEYRLRRHDGAFRWILNQGMPHYRSDGGFAGYIGSCVDLTVRREAARHLEVAKTAAEAASRTKSEFLANMSHEIRTPMTAIIGYADLVLDSGQLPAEQASCVRVIRQNGTYLLSILNDILDFSKLEAGKMTVERMPCSLGEILGDVVSLMTVRAKEKSLDLVVEYSGLVPETIHTDPTRLRQILINLVGNSIKFTESGGVRILTSCLELPGKAGPVVAFEVIDTGIGMTGEQKVKLFRKFSQGDRGTQRKFGGTGLGLVISKRFANMLGGDIVVQSSPGEGSSFMAWVEAGSLADVRMIEKLSQPPPPDPHLPQPLAEQRPATLSGRVLVADDVAVNRKLVSAFLEKAGVAVETADDGGAAVEKAMVCLRNGNPFDLIFMDMHMPLLDGYAATAELRRNGYTGPIVALTASAMAGDREKCLAAGCDDFLTKPVSRQKVLDLSARYMGAGKGGGTGKEVVASDQSA